MKFNWREESDKILDKYRRAISCSWWSIFYSTVCILANIAAVVFSFWSAKAMFLAFAFAWMCIFASRYWAKESDKIQKSADEAYSLWMKENS